MIIYKHIIDKMIFPLSDKEQLKNPRAIIIIKFEMHPTIYRRWSAIRQENEIKLSSSQFTGSYTLENPKDYINYKKWKWIWTISKKSIVFLYTSNKWLENEKLLNIPSAISENT